MVSEKIWDMRIRDHDTKSSTRRERLSSVPNPLRKNGHISSLRFALYVALQNGAFPVWNERSSTVASSSRLDWFLWSVWHVL